MTKVYVKDFETHSVVTEIDVTRVVQSESSYDRFLMGLLRSMDLDKFYVDESEVKL